MNTFINNIEFDFMKEYKAELSNKKNIDNIYNKLELKTKKDNDPIACLVLYYIHSTNEYNLYDDTMSKNYLMKAEKSGNNEAKYILASLLFKSLDKKPELIHKILDYLRSAANKNHIPSILFLAKIIEDGYGNQLTPDLQEAAYFYKKAANEHNVDASFNVGRILLSIDENKNDAFKYLDYAIKNNHFKAKVIMANYYLEKTKEICKELADDENNDEYYKFLFKKINNIKIEK